MAVDTCSLHRPSGNPSGGVDCADYRFQHWHLRGDNHSGEQYAPWFSLF